MQVQNETKPGVYTTEFWLTILTVLSGALIALGDIDIGGLPEWVGPIFAVAGVIGYAISRGLAKNGVPQVVTVPPPGPHADPPEVEYAKQDAQLAESAVTAVAAKRTAPKKKPGA